MSCQRTKGMTSDHSCCCPFFLLLHTLNRQHPGPRRRRSWTLGTNQIRPARPSPPSRLASILRPRRILHLGQPVQSPTQVGRAQGRREDTRSGGPDEPGRPGSDKGYGRRGGGAQGVGVCAASAGSADRKYEEAPAGLLRVREAIRRRQGVRRAGSDAGHVGRGSQFGTSSSPCPANTG